MRRTIVPLLVVLAAVLTPGAPASGQSIGERVFDVLHDLVRGGQRLRGWIVAFQPGELIVRGRDERTYTISTAKLAPSQLPRLRPGEPVKIDLRRGGDPQKPVAVAVRPESGSPRGFRTVTGVVEALAGNRARVRASDGSVVSVDLGQAVGPGITIASGTPVTIAYAQTAREQPLAVWVEPDAALGSGSPRTSEPAGAGGYARTHGLVVSVGIGTMNLKADDAERRRALRLARRADPG